LPGPATGPKHFNELPKENQEPLRALKPAQRFALQLSEGKWPEFALRVVEMAKRNNIDLPRALGPSSPAEFSPAIRDFISKSLEPVLGPEEKKRLKAAENHWPAYPRVILNLARQHHLSVPGMTLPGPPEYWEKFRIGTPSQRALSPDLPDRVLFNFAWKDLTPKERDELRLQPFDTAARDRLKQEYFRRHPDELQRLRTSDRRKDLLAPGGGKQTKPEAE